MAVSFNCPWVLGASTVPYERGNGREIVRVPEGREGIDRSRERHSLSTRYPLAATPCSRLTRSAVDGRELRSFTMIRSLVGTRKHTMSADSRHNDWRLAHSICSHETEMQIIFKGTQSLYLFMIICFDNKKFRCISSVYIFAIRLDTHIHTQYLTDI